MQTYHRLNQAHRTIILKPKKVYEDMMASAHSQLDTGSRLMAVKQVRIVQATC